MGIELMHLHIAALAVELAALITRHHPRRNPRRTQDESGRPGIVGAEATPAVEEEGIDGIAGQCRRLEGVEILALVEARQQRRHPLLRAGITGLELGRQFAGARVARRQLQCTMLLRGLQLGITHHLRPGADAIEQRLLHRSGIDQAVIAELARTRQIGARRIKCKQPALQAGLHENAVAQTLALRLPAVSGQCRQIRCL